MTHSKLRESFGGGRLVNEIATIPRGSYRFTVMEIPYFLFSFTNLAKHGVQKESVEKFCSQLLVFFSATIYLENFGTMSSIRNGENGQIALISAHSFI